MTGTIDPLFDQLIPQNVPLESLYLDPNNPRFVDLQSVYVPDEGVADANAQANALAILEKRYGLDRLRLSIGVNGYLPVDRIIVRPLGDPADEKFVVLEGNRRIAAAKTLPAFTESGTKVDERVLESVKIIPVLVYTGADTDAAWLFQGIRHILGISEWSAYNKARLLVEQMEREGLTLGLAGQRFGTSPQGAGQWVRSYKAFDQARTQTDYAREVDDKFYPYVQELFGRSSIAMKDWLDWDEKAQKFLSVDRFEEFVSWFYPKPALAEDADPADHRGEWDKRRITNRDDIRKISYLIVHAPKHFQLFREGTEFEEAYGQAMVEQYDRQRDLDVDREKKLTLAIRKCTQELNEIPLAMVRDAEVYLRLKVSLEELRRSIDFVAGAGG